MPPPMSKFCWTCGAEKDVRDFPWDLEEYDGLRFECGRCAEMRQLAAELDGLDAPPAHPIEGQGRRKAPRNPTASAHAAALSSALRRRPSSGLVTTEA